MESLRVKFGQDYFPPSGRAVLLALLVSEPVALLLDDVSVPAAVPEPETEPEAEPETEPEALMLSDDVADELVEERSIVDDWLLVDAAPASAEDVSLSVVLLCVSREQPGPRVSAAASNAVAPNKLMFFFMIISSLSVEKSTRRRIRGLAG